jgi:acetoin utilization protein AcuB
MVARDLMTMSPITITPQTRLRHAAQLLHTLEIRHLPVVDERGTLVGMVSDRDLRALGIPALVEPGSSSSRTLEMPVAEVMSSDVLSVETEAHASEVVELMLEHKIGAVPVVDADGALVGIISYMDVLRAIPLEEE